jgi:hypothetical protein
LKSPWNCTIQARRQYQMICLAFGNDQYGVLIHVGP